VRAVRRIWRRLELGWRASLRRLPFFTQRTAVLLVGVLVMSLAMLGGVIALVGWPGANGPTHLVPGEQAGRRPESRPGHGPAAPGGPEAGERSGAGADGAAAARGTQPPGGPAAGARARRPRPPPPSPRAPWTRSTTSSARSSPPCCPEPVRAGTSPGPGPGLLA
jgi:hypothetical protein